MKVLFIIIALLAVLFLLVIVLGLIRSWQVQHKPQQQTFLKGSIPKTLPDGFYKGTIVGLKTTWQGKKFESKNHTGINVFKNGSKLEENYPFTTYVGKGVADKHTTVFKIDYADNKHPWWLKYILDEVVQTSPGHLLGKVHITIIPGLPFTMGYFELER